eukprot:Em0015g50a
MDEQQLKQKASAWLRIYVKCLEERPILTKAITSGVVASLGNLLSQLILKLKYSRLFIQHPISWRSVAAFGVFGLVVTGPVSHYRYLLLDAIFPRKGQVSLLKKLVTDHLFFIPPFLFSLLYTVALLEGKGPSEAWRNAKKIYLTTLVKNWIVWGVAQFINLKYVPLKYRTLFANIVALFWNVCLTMLRQ